MSDIQRWAYQYGGMTPFHPSPGGGWVAYADHVAAVAAARAESQDGDDFWPSRVRHAEERGFKAGVKAAREAIRNTPTDPRWNILQIERSFLAAIDGVKGEQ